MTPPSSAAANWRAIIVDVVAMNVFSLLVAGSVELASGMALMAMLRTRLNSALINTVTGRPYGIWRDWVVLRLARGGGSFRRYLADTLAFVVFQLPLYWVSSSLAGAELHAIVTASFGLTLLAGAMGGPYGRFLDLARRHFAGHPKSETNSNGEIP